jgi:predicted TIM-barrel fold metal-dependent hydrolase
VGPVLEAFGYERILFGSSSAGSNPSRPRSNAGDWYEIARQSLVELGVEQSAVEAVFFNNAKAVYGDA